MRDNAIAQVLNAPHVVMLTARVHSGVAAVVTSCLDRSLAVPTETLPPLRAPAAASRGYRGTAVTGQPTCSEGRTVA